MSFFLFITYLLTYLHNFSLSYQGIIANNLIDADLFALFMLTKRNVTDQWIMIAPRPPPISIKAST